MRDCIDWQENEASFWVDGKQVFQAMNPPKVPLGFVAWVDNNSTSMGPGKEFAFNRIAIPMRGWMELASVTIEKG